MANNIVKNPWIGDGNVFYIAPGYPYFVAGIYKMFGSSNYFAVAFIQILLDTLLCLLLFFLGKWLFNKRVGLLAAFFAAFYRPSIFYSVPLLSDSLILFLNIFTIFIIYWALRKKDYKRWILGGLVLGLAALAKPTILLFLPFLLIGLLVYPKKKFNPFLSWTIVVLLMLIIISPVTVRNWQTSSEFIPICSNGPINYKIGNSIDSIGLFMYPKEPLAPVFSKVFWKLQGKKFMFFFNSYEWPQNLNIYLLTKITKSLKFPLFSFGLLIPLGILGLFLSLNKKSLLLFFFTLCNILWVVAFLVTSRYRLPAVGCLILFAAFSVDWLINNSRIRKQRHLFCLVLLTTLILFLFINRDFKRPKIRKKDFSNLKYLTPENVNYDTKQGRLGLACKKAKTFVNLCPNESESHQALSIVYLNQKKFAPAFLEIKEALRLNPSSQSAKEILSFFQEKNDSK
ncbi:MAG: glycosyltransferase family 39 protein [bacterium]|nr:glycosyltransferase family 39 protein [bacterium]